MRNRGFMTIAALVMVSYCANGQNETTTDHSFIDGQYSPYEFDDIWKIYYSKTKRRFEISSKHVYVKIWPHVYVKIYDLSSQSVMQVANSSTVPAEAVSASLIWIEKSFFTEVSSLKSTELNTPSQFTRRTNLFSGEAGSEFWTMAMDYRRSLIYYTDYAQNYFGVYNVERGTHSTLFHGLSFGIDGIAVDWFTGNVYWTDTVLNGIMVADPTIVHLSRIAEISSRVPSKIAINPLQRSLFWSEVTLSYCSIYRSDLAGNNRILLHQLNDTFSIDDMTIDVNENRLYWTDRILSSQTTARIRSFALDDPQNITTHLTLGSSLFFGIASFQDVLYVSNILNGNIRIYNKTSGSLDLVLQYIGVTARSMVVYHPSVQPWSDAQHQAHPCSENSCEQLCLTDGWDSHFCSCTIGYSLQSNNVSCGVMIIEDNFALILDEQYEKIYQVSLENPKVFSSLPLTNIGTVHSVDYDYVEQKVYWTDTEERKILRSSLTGENREVFMNNIASYSFAIDHASRNLYIADARADSIVVSPLDIANVTVTLHVQNLHTVWKLVVSSTIGKVFWSDWGQAGVETGYDNTGRVESINLDGSDRIVLANDSLGPHGLTVDESSGTLFWTEVVDAVLRWYKLDTGESGRFNLAFPQNIIHFVVEIAYHEGFLYVINQELPSPYRVSVDNVLSKDTAEDGDVSAFGPSVFYSLSGIRIVDESEAPVAGSSSCSNNRGNCPQICLPGNKDFQCACEYHSDYIEANNTCTQVRDSDDNTPPSFGNSCPQSEFVYVDKCSSQAVVDFAIPTATDDSGIVVIKPSQSGSPPFTLSGGVYTFLYKAVDGSGNIAFCSFTYLVFSPSSCLAFPSIPIGATLSNPTCESQYGSLINITCPRKSGISFQYECNDFSVWNPIGDPTCSTEIEATTAASSSATTERTPYTEGSSGSSGSRLSGGIIALIVIVVVVVVVIGIFLIRRYRFNSWFSNNIFWSRRDDGITLTTDGASSSDSSTKGYNPF